MTNEVVDLEKRDYSDDENQEKKIGYDNTEDQIQDDARIKIAFIADTVNEIVIGLRNSGIFNGMAIDFTQIRMNWENDSVEMFKSLIAGDRLSLDEALMVTLDYLNDAELNVRGNPQSINEDLVDKNQLKNEKFKENLLQSFEANHAEIIQRIEEQNAKRDLKNKNFKRANKFNNPVADMMENLSKVIDVRMLNEFLEKNNISVEGILKNKHISAFLSNTNEIEGDFESLSPIDRYTVLKETYLFLSCGEKDDDFQKAAAEMVKAKLNQLPPDIFKDGNYNNLQDLKKAVDAYHKEMYELGEVSDPNFNFEIELANFKLNSDITFDKSNLLSSMEDAEYEALAFKQHMQMARDYTRLVEGDAGAIELGIFAKEISKDSMIPGFLDFMATLQPKTELKRRDSSGCMSIGENGLAEENPKIAKLRNDLDHIFFERYKVEKEADEREHRRGINKFADEYTNEKCRLVIRNRIVREVMTKGVVDPDVLNEMIEVSPSIVRSAIIDLVKDGRGAVSLWEGSSEGTLPINLENIISDPKQLQKIIVAPPVEMTSSIEIDRVDMSRDEEKDYLAEKLKSLSPNQLGTRANYSEKNREVEEKLDPVKNEEAFNKMKAEYNELSKTGDKVAMLEFAERNRRFFERTYSAMILKTSNVNLSQGDTSFANNMAKEFGVLDMLEKSQEAVEDSRALNQFDTLLRKEVNVRPNVVGELLMLSADDRFKDDPRFDYVRQYAKSNAKTYSGIIKSPHANKDKIAMFNDMAEKTPGRLLAAGMFVREMMTQGKYDEIGLREEDGGMVDSFIFNSASAFSEQERKQIHVGFMIEKLSNYKHGDMDYSNFLLQFLHYDEAEIDSFKRQVGSGKYDKLTDKEATDITCISNINRMAYCSEKQQAEAMERLRGESRESIVTATSTLFGKQKMSIKADEKAALLEKISELDPRILPEVQKNLVDMHNANPSAKNVLPTMSIIQGIIDKQKEMGIDFQPESTDVLQESKADYHKIADSGSDGKLNLFENRDDDDSGR